MTGTIKLGDLTVVSDGKLGFSVEHSDGQTIWFNAAGAAALHKWLGDIVKPE